MKRTSFILVASLLFQQVFSQDFPATIKNDIDAYLKQLSSLNRFRGNVLVAKNGTVIYSNSFGLANIEDSIPNTIRTRFPIASLTKAFTATAILMLAEKNVLSVQDKLNKYIPGLPAAWNEITLHHLLTHSSGIPDYSQDSSWLSRRSCGLSFHQTLSLFQNKQLLFSPGTKYNYSNSGYVLLGYIIEKVTGLLYEQVITENIFKALNLTNSFVDDNRTIIHHKARGYVRDGLELTTILPLNMEIGKPAGGIVSTAGDLLKWEQSFYTNKLLSGKSKELMFTIYSGDYGYGWHIDSLNGEKRINHQGVVLGYKTNLDRYVKQKLTVIILCNADDVFINSAIKDIGAIALGKAYKLPQGRKWIILPTEKLKTFTGVYRSENGQVFTIQLKGEHLSVTYKNKTYNLHAETETTFFSDEYDGQLMFSFSGTSKVEFLLYNKKVKAIKS